MSVQLNESNMQFLYMFDEKGNYTLQCDVMCDDFTQLTVRDKLEKKGIPTEGSIRKFIRNSKSELSAYMEKHGLKLHRTWTWKLYYGDQVTSRVSYNNGFYIHHGWRILERISDDHRASAYPTLDEEWLFIPALR